MEVLKLALAMLGHLLGAFFCVLRRIQSTKAMVENSSTLELKKQLKKISDENSSEIEPSVVSGDSASERKDGVHPKTSSEEILPKTNSEEILPKTNSEEILPKTNSEEILPKTNSEEILPKTNSEEILPKTNSEEILPKTNSEEILPKTNSDETPNGADDLPISNGDVNSVSRKDDHENPSLHSEEAVDKVTEKSDMEVDAAANKDDLSDKIEETKENETLEDVADKRGSDESHQNENAKTDDEKIKIVELGSVVEEEEGKQNGGDLNTACESGSKDGDAVEQNASICSETVESVSSDREAESAEAVADSSGNSCKESELLLGEKREEEELQESTEKGECSEREILDETKACTAEVEAKSSVGDESVVKVTDDSSCAEKDVHSQDDVAENMKAVDLDERFTEEVSVLMTTEAVTEQQVIVSSVSVISNEVELIATEENSPEEVSVEDGLVSSSNVEIIESPREEIIPSESESPRPTSRQQISGVQKTEQPYDKCTTETKIAMEIREMREREEELRMMRVRQAYLHSESDSERSLSPGSSRPPSASSQYQLLSNSQPAQSPEPLLLPPGPGYRVSSVFGHKGAGTSPPAAEEEEEQKPVYRIYKESQVEREIRMARDREEELRKEKGLPPREDDSYIKPSQVKSSQTRVFSKINGNCQNQRLLATFKIQQEIEEQTQREMALRETGQIQTISEERTDSKVASLREKDAADTVRTPPVSLSLASKPPSVTNGHTPVKEATTSPTSSVHSGVNPVSRVMGPGKGISMEKFISSRGKETTFSAPKNGSLFGKSQLIDGNRSGMAARPLAKVKRTVSVESKIHQEIMELKEREEELKLLHRCQPQLSADENGDDHQASSSENLQKKENGQSLCDDEDSSDASCPRHNVLIAQWEQRIQEAEGRA